jgi:hypothetical protein
VQPSQPHRSRRRSGMNGDVDAYHDPMDMLHDATQYLDRVRKTLIDADRFEDILQVRSVGELYRQYAGQRRYGIDIQNIGAEIKLRAERRAGELLSAMLKNSGQLFRGDMIVGFAIVIAKKWRLSKPENRRADTVSHLISLAMS